MARKKSFLKDDGEFPEKRIKATALRLECDEAIIKDYVSCCLKLGQLHDDIDVGLDEFDRPDQVQDELLGLRLAIESIEQSEPREAPPTAQDAPTDEIRSLGKKAMDQVQSQVMVTRQAFLIARSHMIALGRYNDAQEVLDHLARLEEWGEGVSHLKDAFFDQLTLGALL